MLFYHRGASIRDIGIILEISIAAVLKALKPAAYRIKPKQPPYACLKIDEFWTYAGKKKNNVRLIYSYHRETGEITAFVFGTA
jgi:hypothetical protein